MFGTTILELLYGSTYCFRTANTTIKGLKMFRFMFLCAAFLFSSPVVGAAGATNVTVDVTELYLLPHTHAGTSKRVYGTLSDQN